MIRIYIKFVIFSALAFAASSCTDGVNGRDGVSESCSAAPVYGASDGTVLGYALSCADSLGGTALDTVWNGTDGTDGSGCSAKTVVSASKDTSYVLVCAGDTVGVIADGTDGAACSASSLASGKGYTVTCGDSTFTLLNGTDGAAGAGCTVADTASAGVTGYKVVCGGTVAGVVWNGTNGTDGAAGKTCTVADTASAGVTGYKVVCGGTVAGVVWNGTAGSDGSDGSGCSLASAGDSIVKICGADTVVTYKAWCGLAHYDPAKQFCVGVTLYDLCGGKSYDPAKQFCDARDSSLYGYVKIGTQTWMAENLNYADSLAMANLEGNSWCFSDNADSCAKYGRLYTWTAAMNIAGSYQTTLAGELIKTPQQGVCPAGWHVPTGAEWDSLAIAAGGSDSAGTRLKSTTGWNGSGNGTDSYGFSALPAGLRFDSGDFYYVGDYAYFWSAMEGTAYIAYNRHLSHSNASMDLDPDRKGNAFSVRCVQN